ncbi:hypothetical protein ACFOQM_05920 [Paenibacillus sp. GCM10012307]|uniref:Uncharacterized protein n=1 Tax=Paenibacillus roseus TaxID=2798579 RepID=A0A934MKA8_9BACL|nr:hypothetical protein [Paenibacillus roseus]MBJ6360835.1 hypothetical protein [Paenibacillus roseus]
MAAENYEGAIDLKNCHNEINKWFDEALQEEHSKEVAVKLLQVAARTLGAQIARVVEPDEVPHLLKETIDSLGQGLQAGMLLHYGQSGTFEVQMFGVSKSRS